MLRFNTKTAITKFDTNRPLNSDPIAFTIATPKIGIDFKQPNEIPYALFYVIGTFESDDEFGGTKEFEAQSITALDNKRKRPNADALFEIAIQSMHELNTAFERQAAQYGFGFTETIFAFREDFTEDSLKAGIESLLKEFYP